MNLGHWKLGVLNGLVVILLVVSACNEAPDPTGIEIGDQKADVFTFVQEEPQYPGGLEALYSYVRNEIRYPTAARTSGVEGRVWVQFVIDRDGSLSDVQVVEGINPDVDREAERVLENAASFIPGSQRGRSVRVRRVMPIVFKLDPVKKNPDNTPQGIVIVEEIQNLDLKLKIDANAVNGEWSGTVYDEETDEPLPGANIVVIGTTRGTVSDLDGSFKIKAATSQDLMISFVGYQNVQLKGKL